MEDQIMADLTQPFNNLLSYLNSSFLQEGEVYAWGKGNYGRLGHGTGEDCPISLLVSLIVQLFLFLQEIEVYTWGKLGHGSPVSDPY